MRLRYRISTPSDMVLHGLVMPECEVRLFERKAILSACAEESPYWYCRHLEMACAVAWFSLVDNYMINSSPLCVRRMKK